MSARGATYKGGFRNQAKMQRSRRKRKDCFGFFLILREITAHTKKLWHGGKNGRTRGKNSRTGRKRR